MIPLNELKPGAWYLGEGRCAPVAKWHAQDKVFRSIDYSCGLWIVAEMEYGKGFLPMRKIFQE